MIIPVINLQSDGPRVEQILKKLRLDPADVALSRGDRAKQTADVQNIMLQVAQRGDDALVEICRKFDDPAFAADQIKVKPEEMRDAALRVTPQQMAALRRSIAQVREYQSHIMPRAPESLCRPGVELGIRFTALDSVGLYFPGGKASYPSSLIMLAVPAQVAGVKTIVVCTPPSKYGRSDLVLAACHELKLQHVYRAGGAAAIAAMAFGTKTIPAVDKIVGPGNIYVQLAKRLLAGCVGVDGFLGPSEIVVIADETGRADYIAADLIAQAEHDPGSCFLLTTSEKLARDVETQLEIQAKALSRQAAIHKALADDSAIIVHPSMDELIALANRFAAEHVNVQVREVASVVERLTNACAVFVGPYSPVAAGDYIAGPSHCLPTNTTARFSSGISVYEFLKRSSIARYDSEGLTNDAAAIIELANAEHLDGHAASIRARLADR
jgi:histidinol dehydrogenase